MQYNYNVHFSTKVIVFIHIYTAVPLQIVINMYTFDFQPKNKRTNTATTALRSVLPVCIFIESAPL